MKYRDYTISKAGFNYTVNKPSGERLGAELAATPETAKKWVDMDINEHAAAQRRRLRDASPEEVVQYCDNCGQQHSTREACRGGGDNPDASD